MLIILRSSLEHKGFKPVGPNLVLFCMYKLGQRTIGLGIEFNTPRSIDVVTV